MRINRMNATFGKLDQATLELQPGLNILYAPNESGKSTWSQFIRIMLYGLSTRERGPMAAKNRFAPWNGNTMRGRMDVEADGQRYTILRDTARATAPMGEFRCTYTDTANEVPGITSQTVGEVLLGVGSEVFSRSAFIGQSGLTVDQDAELERRILSLLTSGEEEISYSQTRDALKKQLNRRKANKSAGLIPALERECLQLEEALAQLQSLHQQEDAARLLLQQRQQQEAEVRLRIGQWEDLQKQEALRCCLRAQQEAQQADARAAELEKTPIPDAAYLARLEGMAQALDHTLNAAKEAEETARKLRQEAEAAGKVWRDHPLYPADEATLQQRLQEPAAAGAAFPWGPVVAGLLAGAAAGAGVWLFLSQLLPAVGIGAAAAVAIFLIYNGMLHSARRKAAAQAQIQRDRLAREAEAYLQLLQRARTCREQAEQARTQAESAQRSCRESLLQLLSLVQPFAPEATDLTNVRTALERAIARRRHVDEARQKARDAQLHSKMLREHLPQGPLPDAQAQLPRPATPYAQLVESLPRAMAAVGEAQSRLDNLGGQIRSAGDREMLESQLGQKRQELQRLQQEYDAIAMAMDALEQANLTMQNRFSPALGQRAAQIFSRLTAGRYDKVLLHRDFSLSAEPAGDPTPRSVQLLSQGAADQLYLAVRLAICDLVLPEEKAVPLILDDALANFDDQRMAAALDFLAEEGQRRQILLFTCQKREGEYLSGRGGVSLLSL